MRRNPMPTGFEDADIAEVSGFEAITGSPAVYHTAAGKKYRKRAKKRVGKQRKAALAALKKARKALAKMRKAAKKAAGKKPRKSSKKGKGKTSGKGGKAKKSKKAKKTKSGKGKRSKKSKKSGAKKMAKKRGKKNGAKKTTHRRKAHKKLKSYIVPALGGRKHRKRTWIRVKSNPGGEGLKSVFSWLKFGLMVMVGFAGATVVNKLASKYLGSKMPGGVVPPVWSGLGLTVLLIMFGRKLIKKPIPASIITGVVANTMISAVSQFYPAALEWLVPAGSGMAALPNAGVQAYTTELKTYSGEEPGYGGIPSPYTEGGSFGDVY